MVQLILACLLLLRSLAPTQVNTQSFGRGTAIVFIFGESGLVVASDGLAQNFSSDHSGIVRKEAEPKISVCNKSFLCAMAGVNPAVFPSVGIEYHFREWLPTPSGKKRASLREYADAMEDKARMTFKGLDLLLKSGEPEYSYFATAPELSRYAIAGYDEGVLKFCEFRILIDHNKKELVYSERTCWTPAPMDNIAFSGSAEAVNQWRTPGTSQYLKLMQIYPKALAAAKTLFPDAPPPLKKLIAEAVGWVGLQTAYDPNQYGGTTRVGVVIKGKLPKVVPLS